MKSPPPQLPQLGGAAPIQHQQPLTANQIKVEAPGLDVSTSSAAVAMTTSVRIIFTSPQGVFPSVRLKSYFSGNRLNFETDKVNCLFLDPNAAFFTRTLYV